MAEPGDGIVIDLLAVYICPKHGDILEDVVMDIEEVDTANDEVYQSKSCICGREVMPKLDNGIQVFEKVDHEQWLWMTGFYDQILEADDD